MNSQKSRENLIYLILWIMVFTFPVLLSTGGNRIDWIRVSREILRIFPFFLVFMMNNFVIFRFFRNKNYVYYFLLTAIIVLTFSFIGSFEQAYYRILHIPHTPSPQGKQDVLKVLNTFFYNSIFSVLVIGLNNAIKISFDWFQEKRNIEELQKENLKNQLALLQHQISPHFLMNTLNNIHALIDYDQEIAKNSVIKLSKLMRVLLYENENYTLEKEIQFLNDYIDLMKIRVNRNVDIELNYPDSIPHLNIPPLLFVSLVENAFKHGILATGHSFVHISITLDADLMNFNIKNSRNDKTGQVTEVEKIGLNNVRKRLDLIYGKKYTFEVRESVNSYEVHVRIPLDENKMPGH